MFNLYANATKVEKNTYKESVFDLFIGTIAKSVFFVTYKRVALCRLIGTRRPCCRYLQPQCHGILKCSDFDFPLGFREDFYFNLMREAGIVVLEAFGPFDQANPLFEVVGVEADLVQVGAAV